MNLILACTSYWNSPEQYQEQLTGRTDPSRIVSETQNIRHHLRPQYEGRLGLQAWHDRFVPMIKPIETVVACGTWSDPSLSTLPVTVVNSGVEPTLPHSMHWQYMGCALTALCAHVLRRKDWDVMVLLESDTLTSPNLDLPAWAGNFTTRSEWVAGPAWMGVHCDFVLWKREACIRYLHQRFRPNLSMDKWCLFLDYELAALYEGKAWNPWPTIPTIRADYWHQGSPQFSKSEMLAWPIIRQPDPAIIDEYLNQKPPP